MKQQNQSGFIPLENNLAGPTTTTGQNLRGSLAGFTIIEVMVAVIFVAVISIGLSQFIVNTREVSNFARRESQATLAAEKKLEELRNTPFSSIVSIPNFSSELSDDLINPAASVVVTDETATLKRIDITISYNDDTVVRTQQFRSYIAKPGITQ